MKCQVSKSRIKICKKYIWIQDCVLNHFKRFHEKLGTNVQIKNEDLISKSYVYISRHHQVLREWETTYVRVCESGNMKQTST